MYQSSMLGYKTARKEKKHHDGTIDPYTLNTFHTSFHENTNKNKQCPTSFIKLLENKENKNKV